VKNYSVPRYKLLSREGKLNARGHSIEMKDNLNVVANKEKDILLLFKRSFPPGGLVNWDNISEAFNITFTSLWLFPPVCWPLPYPLLLTGQPINAPPPVSVDPVIPFPFPSALGLSLSIRFPFPSCRCITLHPSGLDNPMSDTQRNGTTN
jgi:hypothetical protein